MKLVLVEWIDSRGVGQHWSQIANLSEKPCKMKSVGWLVKDTKKYICIAPHVGFEKDNDNQCCGEMYIPKKCIKNILKINAK